MNRYIFEEMYPASSSVRWEFLSLDHEPLIRDHRGHHWPHQSHGGALGTETPGPNLPLRPSSWPLACSKNPPFWAKTHLHLLLFFQHVQFSRHLHVITGNENISSLLDWRLTYFCHFLSLWGHLSPRPPSSTSLSWTGREGVTGWPSHGALMVKEYICQQTWEFSHWFGKILSRRKWQPTPVFLQGQSHRQRSLVGPSPRGCKE